MYLHDTNEILWKSLIFKIFTWGFKSFPIFLNTSRVLILIITMSSKYIMYSYVRGVSMESKQVSGPRKYKRPCGISQRKLRSIMDASTS